VNGEKGLFVDDMKLVIIAGGKGTRLGLNDKPKPMITIGGKPLLEHQITLAKQYGIQDIFILSGYLSNVIIEHFGDGTKFGVSITHIIEQEPLGTAGAVKQLEGMIKGRFLVFYGDILLSFDVRKLREFDALQPSLATLVVHPNDHPSDSDLVEMDDKNVIVAFHPKHRDQNRYYRNLVNAAVYILSDEIFRYIPAGEQTDFGKDIFPPLLEKGKILRAYNTAEYIKDIGTLHRLQTAQEDFTSGKIERTSKRHKRPAIFIDRDGTLVKDVHLLHRVEDLELYPYSGSAIKKINDSEYLCFLITNQPVVARNLCDEAVVRKIHNKLETLIAEQGAYLDNIYYCPHHPDRGFPGENPDYKIECDCRKPRTGMIERAAKEFNVDTKRSWLIGDTTTDLQTGINAGMQTILLRTGRGGKDGKFDGAADYVFDHLGEAVDFILGGIQRHQKYIVEVLDRMQSKKGRSPFVISVAGLARSGKSTFINLLMRILTRSGIESKVISLDNWLISVNERTENMTVRERYHYDEIASDVERLLAGEKILINTYDPYSRSVVGRRPISMGSAQCLIIDGIPALDIVFIRKMSDIKIYVDVDEIVREARFFSFYRWKDLPDETIERLYRKRLHDEVLYIRESGRYADILVEVN
jgi:histidinol-phosphate phosphatase family protein